MDDCETRVAGLCDRFDIEIKRIDQILSEREKQTNLALEAAQRAINKSEAEAERVRTAANEWRGAMADREKGFVQQASHDLLQGEVDYIRRGIDQSNGRRAAWVASAGIITTLLAIGIGQIIRQGITSADVSTQIQREAPWNRDKDAVTRRIVILEKQVQSQDLEISSLKSDLRAHVILDAQRDK